MRKTESRFSVIDFLIIVAMLMIVVGMFGAHLHKTASKARRAEAATAVVPSNR
ncbi:MAG: hypothetical protein ABSG54_05035 [Terriglobia bacterium]|jgi:hypothetical protein